MGLLGAGTYRNGARKTAKHAKYYQYVSSHRYIGQLLYSTVVLGSLVYLLNVSIVELTLSGEGDW